MLSTERHQRIMNRIREYGSVKTKELADELQVTDETIRKDFEYLKQKGLLLRSHGGAVPSKHALGELSMTERQMINWNAKNAIAKAAAFRIQPNETVFIDASSTALTLTQYLPDFHITVISNSHDVVGSLAGSDHIDVICTGGLFEPRSRSMIGVVAEKTLHRYNINRMFFSGNGLDLSRGVSEGNSRQAAFKERVIAAAEDVCMLADASKIGQRSAFFFAECKDLNTLVTTRGASADILESLQKLAVEIVIAD